jgi:hypothetical protein
MGNIQQEIREAGNYWEHDYQVKPVYIATQANVGAYDLPDKSILQQNKKVIGISIPVSAAGKKNETGKALLNTNAYACAYLVLNSDATTERLRLRFEMFAPRSGGDNYFLRLPLDNIDIANSKVIIGDATTAANNEVIEIDFFYEAC